VELMDNNKKPTYQLRHITGPNNQHCPNLNEIVYETRYSGSMARYAGFYFRNFEHSRESRHEICYKWKKWTPDVFEKKFREKLKTLDYHTELEAARRINLK